MPSRSLFAAILAGLSLLAQLPAQAHESGEKLTVLQEHLMTNAPGMKATMLSVEYAPGQATVAHRHDGSAIAYVLQGAIVSQIEGQAPVTYKAGESWYEPAGTHHLVSKNASNSQPATLLVWILGTEQQPVLVPLQQ
ncbi:cupin [Pseudomonas alcaligenes]|uniref:Cupin n=1 Tax=Aquipseudomonas alcaligenes TaxID=43263 RepID=A0ABR7S260_AQUAC|nr:cupin domain-containing protein [Pseudomonas alcaligenes]MBC9251665.1 cupin [Pseudomonas alcaligenes]